MSCKAMGGVFWSSGRGAGTVDAEEMYAMQYAFLMIMGISSCLYVGCSVLRECALVWTIQFMLVAMMRMYDKRDFERTREGKEGGELRAEAR